MNIIPGTKKYAKQISILMTSDLNKFRQLFPAAMMTAFRDHAQENNILEEFNNSNLISFLAIGDMDLLMGFIVGYKEKNSAMIHYITAETVSLKKQLLAMFITKCREEKIDRAITDTFIFMENNAFFRNEGFILFKKEKIEANLEMLWYEKKV